MLRGNLILSVFNNLGGVIKMSCNKEKKALEEKLKAVYEENVKLKNENVNLKKILADTLNKLEKIAKLMEEVNLPKSSEKRRKN